MKYIRKVSIIVPARNEEESIQALVTRINSSMVKENIEYEIIFVDDSSTDDTVQLVDKLSKSYPVSLISKKGKKGKAYSLIEGFACAKYNNIAMIDADLQYPPEAIPEMLLQLKDSDVVVSRRKNHHTSILRKLMSHTFKYVFGKMMFGLTCDVQSGLKVFKKEVIETVSFKPRSQWTFDLDFLHRADMAGYKISNYDIELSARKNGVSKINFINSSLEISMSAVLLKIKKVPPQPILGAARSSMKGAGIAHRKKRYITHTTLPHEKSALQTFTFAQKVGIVGSLLLLAISLVLHPFVTLAFMIGILSFIYFIDVIFNFYVILKSLNKASEIKINSKNLEQLDEEKLPVYSILCPLYREAHVIPQFLQAISNLDWPKNKLDVLMLLEEDDVETIRAVRKMALPPFVRMLIVPHSLPKTKPKACNWGLSFAKGEYLVIYDAEDIPESSQLKKAYLAFKKVPRNVFCLQAKLNYYNPYQNILTRLFTAEYSLWFDVTLTGFQSVNTSIPLGGTSNHFRTRDLVWLQGWDPFNVTEDADLGVRLFKEGYKTAIIDSTTYEEANSRFGNWLRQRSRWIKGYMQTYLVHTRSVREMHREKKATVGSLLFHLVIGGKIAFILINPLLWIATISYFAAYSYVGPTIESLYPSYILYIAVASLVMGNFLYMYYYMVGCARRKQWDLIKFAFVVPLYWVAISFAGFVALYQLLFKPHFWEKTVHGFHLSKIPPSVLQKEVVMKKEVEVPVSQIPQPRAAFIFSNLMSKMFSRTKYVWGGALIASMMVSNVFNLIYNAYLGRVLDLQTFGILSLVGSFYYVATIPFSSVFATVNNRNGFLIGRFGEDAAGDFWSYASRKMFIVSTVVVVSWILLSPLLQIYFHAPDIFPFLFFIPVWLVGFASAVNKGYISAKFEFGALAVIIFLESISKLAFGYLFAEYRLSSFVYISIPLSVVIAYFLTLPFVLKRKNSKDQVKKTLNVSSFPTQFFIASMLTGLATTCYLTLDIILAKHFLSPEHAGEYALISVISKVIFFLGTLSIQFLTPLVSRNEGENKDSEAIFYKIFFGTLSLTVLSYVFLIIFGNNLIPLIFGSKALNILRYIPLFAFGMLCFTLSQAFVLYYLNKKIYSFSVISLILSLVQYIAISYHHGSIGDIVNVMAIVGILNFAISLMLHIFGSVTYALEYNTADFLGLFTKLPLSYSKSKYPKILIFNWRDTQHTWAGGAENYIHEIAKRWSDQGAQVTVFCGNDFKSAREQMIDGVQIIRRGGFYTLYIWAALYYIFKLHGKYDVIIDSENGIPFFTPLFVKKPIFLLIHHIHQDVFRQHLHFPLAQIAEFMETKLMPFIYRNENVITVSESSKQEILQLGLAAKGNIDIVHPGVSIYRFTNYKKTKHPSFIYLGRLKSYKNVDIAIKAFAYIVKADPSAIFTIAGFGEEKDKLLKLTKKLNLESNISFIGSVSEKLKFKLLSESWIALQPSMIEGWGITVIEANACGTPVIASNVRGLRDSVIDGKTGILVNSRNISEFAQAMERSMMNTALRRSLTEEAYIWSRNFSWEKSAKEFLTMIKFVSQEAELANVTAAAA